MTEIELKVKRLVLSEVSKGLGTDNDKSISALGEKDLDQLHVSLLKRLREDMEHLEELRVALRSISKDEVQPR